MKPTAGLASLVCATLAFVGITVSPASAAPGSAPVAGSVMFNEYNSVNVPTGNPAAGNDYFELLVVADGVDLRGIRVSDNELASPAGVMNNGESVFVFGTDTFLENVPKGTLVTVWTTPAGIGTDTIADPSSGDWKMVLTPGVGVALTADGLGGTTNAGLSASGEALYLYLPGPDGSSAGTDNVYLDYISWEASASVAPAGLVDVNLPSVGDAAYITGDGCAPGRNDVAANWTTHAATPLVSPSTPGEVNTSEDLSNCRTPSVQVPLGTSGLLSAGLALGVVVGGAVIVRRRRVRPVPAAS